MAREWGDLKENAEYHAAKDEAAMLEARIARMRDQLRSAEIVEPRARARARHGLDRDLRRRGAARAELRLVPSREADPAAGSISIDSPAGKALAGAKAGDMRALETRGGSARCESWQWSTR